MKTQKENMYICILNRAWANSFDYNDGETVSAGYGKLQGWWKDEITVGKG